MGKFVFEDISDDDLKSLVGSAKVFNLPRESILNEKVVLASVDDETWGSAEERLDIAICDRYSGGERRWRLLDIRDKVEGYNEIPLGYLLEGQAFIQVLVIIRRLSSFLMDKTTSGQTVYIYSVVSDVFSEAVKDPVFLGKMAQYKIYLDRSPRQVYRQIRDTIEDKEKQERLISYVKDFLKGTEGDDSG